MVSEELTTFFLHGLSYLIHPLSQMRTHRKHISEYVTLSASCVSHCLFLFQRWVLCCSPFERDFEAVLLSSQVLDLLGGGDRSDGDAIDAYLKRRVLAYLDNSTEEDKADG